MKRLLLCLTLSLTLGQATAQNIFEISPDSSNPNYERCKYREYDDSARLIVAYMGSLVSQRYLKECSTNFLSDMEDGERKQELLVSAVDRQISSCYSQKDTAFIRNGLTNAVGRLPEFCDNGNVKDALNDWRDKLRAEK